MENADERIENPMLSGVRKFLMIAVTASCSLESGSPPVSFERTYSIEACWNDYIPATRPPCITEARHSSTSCIDSGRAVFTADGRVSWMLGTHVYTCTCTCTTVCAPPCVNGPGIVLETTGSYVVRNQELILTFPVLPDGELSDLVLPMRPSNIPARVRGEWRGPDWLQYTRVDAGYGAGYVRFKSM